MTPDQEKQLEEIRAHAADPDFGTEEERLLLALVDELKAERDQFADINIELNDGCVVVEKERDAALAQVQQLRKAMDKVLINAIEPQPLAEILVPRMNRIEAIASAALSATEPKP